MPDWRDRKPEDVIVSGSIGAKPERTTMAYKQSSSGIPIFRKVWLVSDAPERKDRVLENQVADPRLWDPSDENFWSVCLPTDPDPLRYRV